MIDKRALTRRRLGLKQQSDQRNQNVSVVPGCHDTPSQGRHLRRPPPGAPSSCRRPCDRLRQLRLLNFRLRSRQLHAAQSSCFTSHLPRRCRFFPVRCRPCFPVFPETSLSPPTYFTTYYRAATTSTSWTTSSFNTPKRSILYQPRSAPPFLSTSIHSLSICIYIYIY